MNEGVKSMKVVSVKERPELLEEITLYFINHSRQIFNFCRHIPGINLCGFFCFIYRQEIYFYKSNQG